jgi:hypothetical protein
MTGGRKKVLKIFNERQANLVSCSDHKQIIYVYISTKESYTVLTGQASFQTLLTSALKMAAVF